MIFSKKQKTNKQPPPLASSFKNSFEANGLQQFSWKTSEENTGYMS